jgi:hypothetical protein
MPRRAQAHRPISDPGNRSPVESSVGGHFGQLVYLQETSRSLIGITPIGGKGLIWLRFLSTRFRGER